jgi:hypothetical protein
MKKFPYLLILILLAMLVSCVSQKVKYSPSEISIFSTRVQEHIMKSEVALGMPIAAVRYSWGAPQAIKILTPDDEGNLREEWIYTKFRLYATRVIFTDGKVTGIISGMRKLRKSKKSSEEKLSEEELAVPEEEGQTILEEEESR